MAEIYNALKERAQNLSWVCRYHPTDGWHEIGCPHLDWTREQLYSALLTKKEYEQERHVVVPPNERQKENK